jgi:hypothetical protein
MKEHACEKAPRTDELALAMLRHEVSVELFLEPVDDGLSVCDAAVDVAAGVALLFQVILEALQLLLPRPQLQQTGQANITLLIVARVTQAYRGERF